MQADERGGTERERQWAASAGGKAQHATVPGIRPGRYGPVRAGNRNKARLVVRVLRLPEVRKARVALLRDAVSRGCYWVNAAKVAAAMLADPLF